MEKHIASPEHAQKMAEWLVGRGGIAVWKSVNLSNPGASWSTPALNMLGQPYEKPTWQAESTPSRIITDAADVEVHVPKEVKRFRVGVKRGDGLMVVVTDGGTRRIRKEVAKAGDTAWYEFDYSTQEAVIFVADKVVSLVEFVGGLPLVKG